MAGGHAMYRYFDAEQVLLYIGKSGALASREQAHIATSDWMELAASSTIERFGTPEELADAERAAILSEHPIFNKQHTTYLLLRRGFALTSSTWAGSTCCSSRKLGWPRARHGRQQTRGSARRTGRAGTPMSAARRSNSGRAVRSAQSGQLPTGTSSTPSDALAAVTSGPVARRETRFPGPASRFGGAARCAPHWRTEPARGFDGGFLGQQRPA
jgi:hypothetical protein